MKGLGKMVYTADGWGCGSPANPLRMDHCPVLSQAAQGFCKVRNPPKAEIPPKFAPPNISLSYWSQGLLNSE